MSGDTLDTKQIVVRMRSAKFILGIEKMLAAHLREYDLPHDDPARDQQWDAATYEEQAAALAAVEKAITEIKFPVVDARGELRRAAVAACAEAFTKRMREAEAAFFKNSPKENGQ